MFRGGGWGGNKDHQLLSQYFSLKKAEDRIYSHQELISI